MAPRRMTDDAAWWLVFVFKLPHVFRLEARPRRRAASTGRPRPTARSTRRTVLQRLDFAGQVVPRRSRRPVRIIARGSDRRECMYATATAMSNAQAAKRLRFRQPLYSLHLANNIFFSDQISTSQQPPTS